MEQTDLWKVSLVCGMYPWSVEGVPGLWKVSLPISGSGTG